MDKQQAMALWCGALCESVRQQGADLSARQMAILLTVYISPPPHTVRGLAKLLDISKPAVTRALDALSGLDLLKRQPDPADKRSILVARTVAGAVFLNEFAQMIIDAADTV